MRSSNTKQGYDSPHGTREEDDLDRWRFASEIADIVFSTPPDWSTRIGIFGKWGEGKSTVLRFAEQMLRDKGNVVFWFNPWAIQNWNDLWEEFGDGLCESLIAANIPLDLTWKEKIKDAGKWLESKGAGRITEAVAAAVGRDKLVDATFGALSRWLKYDGEQIRKIRQSLGEKRVVVLVDDLDRCAPELLPQLLLSLREILDLPGFTFLLAFDDDIVSNAIVQKNPAWVDGSKFLEKILDFRFYLPAITSKQKKRFMNRAIEHYCGFVPGESIENVLDLLPDNPRKLKALIRNMASLKPQVLRHDPQELNWKDIWLAQLLRLESYRFIELLLRADTLDEQVGIGYAFASKISEDKKEDVNLTLKQLIAEAGVDDPVPLLRLMEAIRSRSSFTFRYACEVAIRPHAITWKEFRLLCEAWDSDPTPSRIATWLTQQATERGVAVEDVEEELFTTLLIKRQEHLAAAADSGTVLTHDSYLSKAESILNMVKQFLLDLGHLEPSRFQKLYGKILRWIEFHAIPSDRDLRDREEKLILDLLELAPIETSSELLEVLKPWASWDDFVSAGESRKALLNRCSAVIAPRVAKQAIGLLTLEGGMRSLSEQGRFIAFKYCLFDSSSPVWTTQLKDELITLLNRGLEEPIIYENAKQLLDLLIEARTKGTEFRSDGVGPLLSDEVFVAPLWRTATSREIQWRMQIKFLRYRQALLQNGIGETSLPLRKELQARLEAETAQAAPARDGSSQA